jgi:hypothetical protein
MSTTQYQYLSDQLKLIHSTLGQFDRRLSRFESSARTPATPPPAPLPAATSQPHWFESPGTFVLELPINTPRLLVTMVAGGGAGSCGDLDENISGSGGGAGESVVQRLVPLAGWTGKILVTVGAGGCNEVETHGEASSIEIPMQDGTSQIIKALGGQGAAKKTGGAGGVSSFHDVFSGQRGGDSLISIGGAGGCSYFAKGGAGGNSYYSVNSFNQIAPNPKGADGFYGSGGGGSQCGLDPSIFGRGGNGFVMILS